MAFSKQQRAALIGQIVVNSSFQEDQLLALTDNQLVALNSPQQLDTLVNNACSTAKKLTNNEEDMEEEEDMEDTEDTEEMDSEEEPAPEAGAKKPTPPSNPVEAKVNKTAEQTTNAWLRQAPPEIRRIVANARAVEEQRREALIQTITANAACPLDAEALSQRSTEDLEIFASMSQQQEAPVRRIDFSGASGAFSVNSSKVKITPLGLPTADYMK